MPDYCVPDFSLGVIHTCGSLLSASTSNDRITLSTALSTSWYVFDAETREHSSIIDMPKLGDPHGLVWADDDDDGVGREIRDQGGFHHGVHPAYGNPPVY